MNPTRRPRDLATLRLWKRGHPSKKTGSDGSGGLLLDSRFRGNDGLKVGVLLLGIGLLFGCAHLPLPASPDSALSPEEHVTLGNTYLAQKDKVLAAQQYKDALQVNKAYVPALVALGNMAFEDNDLKTARVYFERAQKASPKDPAVVNNLAMVCLAQGKDLKGIDVMVEDALEGAGPATPYLWDTLANIAIQEGRFEDAKKALNKAAETAPAQDPTFQKHLQDSREKLASAAPTTPAR